MNVFAVLEHFTHQFIGGPFFRADVFRCRNDELHIKTLAKLKQRGNRAGIKTRRFIQEQQAAWRDVFTAQTARFIFPALYNHHQNGHPGTDRFTGRERPGFRTKPAV